MIATVLFATLSMLGVPPSVVPADPEPNSDGQIDRTTPQCTLFTTHDLYVGADDQSISVRKSGPDCDALGVTEEQDKRFSIVGKTATGTTEIVVRLKSNGSQLFLTPDSDALVPSRGSWTVFEYGKKDTPKATLALDIEELAPKFDLHANYRIPELQTLLETHPVAAGTLVVDPTGDGGVSNFVLPTFPSGFPVTAPVGMEWHVESKSRYVELCVIDDRKEKTCGTRSDEFQSLRQIELISRTTVALPVRLELTLQPEPGSTVRPTGSMRLTVEVAKQTASHELPLPLEDIAYVTCPIRRGNQARIRAERGGTLDAVRGSLKDGECKLLLSEDLLLLALAERHSGIEAAKFVIGKDGVERRKFKQSRESSSKEKPDAPPSNYCDENASDYYIGETCAYVTSADGVSITGGRAGAKAREDALKLAALYGPQSAYVCVKPEASSDGAGVLCSSIDYDPRLKSQRRHEVRLPIDGTKLLEPSKTYDVSVVRATAADEAKKSDGVLVSRLRSRGAFGVRSLKKGGSVRFFLTAPVNVAAIQFPSSLHDLRTSDDTRGMQIVGLDLGLKLAIEPWNYRHAENPWPLNPVFIPGALFFRNFGTTPAARTRTRAIFASGVEIRLPLVRGANQADVAFALGLFHGRDIRHNESQFLVTLGIDVLSIFGAASDEK